MRCENPWSKSSGTTQKTSARPTANRAAASAASAGRRLFSDDILKRSPAKCRKDRVVQREEGEVAAAAPEARPHAGDDDRQCERQEEERQQELTNSCGGGH